MLFDVAGNSVPVGDLENVVCTYHTAIQYATGLSITPNTNQEITLGDTLTLSGTLSPNDINNKEITWSTDDKTVASFGGNTSATTVTGANLTLSSHKPGTVTIKATPEDGSGQSASIKVTVIATQVFLAQHPIIPTGFTHVEGAWNTGYVIRETATGDEFVWIPVQSSSEYARKSGSKNYHMSAGNVVDSGKDVKQYILADKLGMTTILGKTITETQRSGSTAANIPEANVVNAAGGFYVSRYEIGIVGATRSATQSGWTKYNIYSKAGYEPVRNITQTKALELANTWKSGSNHQSGLITGTQWDVMCNFIGWSTCDSDCTNWGNYCNASGTFGKGHMGTSTEYANANHTYWTLLSGTNTKPKSVNTRTIAATGSFTNTTSGSHSTAQKNIYDVAGNVWEWTTEMPTYNSTHRVLRGGGTYYSDGSDLLATCRNGGSSAGDSSWHFGFRVALYVK